MHTIHFCFLCIEFIKLITERFEARCILVCTKGSHLCLEARKLAKTTMCKVVLLTMHAGIGQLCAKSEHVKKFNCALRSRYNQALCLVSCPAMDAFLLTLFIDCNFLKF